MTNDVRPLAAPGAAPVYAAILAPSGRVAHDVFLHRELGAGASGGAVLADLPAATFDAAVSLLRKMRLRARVTLDDAGDDLAVVVRADDDRAAMDDPADAPDAASPSPRCSSAPPHTPLAFLPVDPRLDALGVRGVLPTAAANAALLVNPGDRRRGEDAAEAAEAVRRMGCSWDPGRRGRREYAPHWRQDRSAPRGRRNARPPGLAAAPGSGCELPRRR